MHINDIIPQHELLAAIDAGLVREQQHPELPYTILNYTKAAQAGGHWNRATINARGLIIHRHTGEVIARPFKKFFNHNEIPRQEWRRLLDEPVVVTDKLDGSLGILYPDGKGSYAIATRGSFTSEQAIEGTRIFQETYADEFQPEPGFTYMFEIIYPENRIVVDYDNRRDLVLIGIRSIESGWTWSPLAGTAQYYGWFGPVAEPLPYTSAEQALFADPRPGKEGVVVHFQNSGRRVKIKQQDYIEKHRVVTNLSEKVIWEHLSKGPIDDLIKELPEEHAEWAVGVADALCDSAMYLVMDLESRYFALEEAGLLDDRKGFALAIKDLEKWQQAALFAWLDGRSESFDEIVWNQVKPKEEK